MSKMHKLPMLCQLTWPAVVKREVGEG